MTARTGTRIVVTRGLPVAALRPLPEVGEVWVSPHDRPLTAAELREAVRGASAIAAMLTDRIDGGVLNSAGPSLPVVANGRRLRQPRPGRLRSPRRDRHEHPGVLVDATADLTMALLLPVTRRIAEGASVAESTAVPVLPWVARGRGPGVPPWDRGNRPGFG
jgi:glyoxylate reductase